MDWLDVIDFSQALSKEFDFHIEPEDIQKCTTEGVVEYLDQRLNAARPRSRLKVVQRTDGFRELGGDPVTSALAG
jgi:hypothetical protein